MSAYQDHFKQFASWLDHEMVKYGELNKDFAERQKVQLETLLALELEFRTELINHRCGAAVYREFIEHITVERKNILSARPFFRERQGIFTKEISKALKAKSEKTLFKFRFNIQFIHYVLGVRQWNSICKRLPEIAEEIHAIRTEIVEQNMPLAISRARIFWSRTPKSHLTLMDFVQIAAEGLIAGIDKYVPEGEIVPRSFRGVAIGRMTGNFIESYSETQLHFYPCDKRKIYRANKVVHRHAGGVDYEKLAGEVSAGMTAGQITNASEIANLMAAASVVSADTMVTSGQDPDAPEPISRFAAPEACQPDRQVEHQDALHHLKHAIAQLSILDQKLLRLKGIRL